MTKFGPHVEILEAVAGSVSGRLVAIGGHRDAGVRESRVHVMQASTAKAKSSIKVDGPVGALEFLHDDLLVIGADGKLIGGDVGGDDPKRAFVVSTGAGMITAMARDRMGRRIAVGTEGGKLFVYRLEVEGGRAALRSLSEREVSSRPLRGVAIDDATDTVAAAGDDGVVRTAAIDRLASSALREMPCGEGGIWSLAFTGDGRIVAGCGDGSLRVCFLEGAIDQEDRSGDAAHKGAVRALIQGPELLDEAERPLPRRLFSVGEDGELKSWQLDTKRKPRTVALGSAKALAAAYLATARQAKPEEAGGKLAAVNEKRQIVIVTLDHRSDPSDSVLRIESELERLAEDLGAKGVQVRLDAVEALGALPEDDARALLDRALAGDLAPEVRQRAAEVIGQTDRRLSRPALRRALDDAKKEVREAALAALTSIERDTPLSPVRAGLGSAHADLRAVSVRRLPGLRATSPLVPGLIAGKLSDAEGDVRNAALDALRELEGPTSLDWVRIAIDRGPPDVRVAALLRLAYAKRARDAEGHALVEAALDDDDASVRAVAFYIAVGARPRLAKRLIAVDVSTAKALGDFAKKGTFSSELASGETTEQDLQPLFAALACRSPDTALRGARALAVLGDVRAVGALLQLSRESDVVVRRHGVESLLAAASAMPEDERIVARLEWLLDDADDNIAGRAFEGLRALAEAVIPRSQDGESGEASRTEVIPRSQDGESGGPLLDHAELSLRTSREDIRFRALQILVEFGGQGKHAKHARLAERADRLLGDALDDEAPKVRGEAFRTLWAWHSSEPKTALRRGASSRHADVRARVVEELPRIAEKWAEELLLTLVADASSDVGLAAFKALTKEKRNNKRSDLYLMAMSSPRPDVRAAGCQGCHEVAAADLRSRILELIDQEYPIVHTAAIEAADALMPADAEAFRRAFSSIFYGLRVRAGELLGKRRDKRALEPMKALLTIPKTHLDRPSDEIRQRAARALADVGDPQAIPFYVALLDDVDPLVREMGGRGLATACRPGEEKALADALSHPDLAVRSWAAEGLARLGDVRAIPVLSGTLKHPHRPIRMGSIIGLVALGPDGVRGLLQGLEDPDREIQDFAFAIIVARDVALAKRQLPPDLLLSALSAGHPELRFAAARALEERPTSGGSAIGEIAAELVGPRKLERASDMKDWPAEEERKRLLEVIVQALASDHPVQRYSAAQVLSLRHQPDGFWREARRLAKPGGIDRPHTNWEDEQRQPRKKDWLRRLFGKSPAPAQSGTERVLTILRYAGAGEPVPAEGDQDASPKGDRYRQSIGDAREGRSSEGRAEVASPRGDRYRQSIGDAREGRSSEGRAEVASPRGDRYRLVFGAYAGLIRQAPPPGDADETHRVRRDALERLAVLAKEAVIGREAVLPIFRRALSDPHHLVRKAAVGALSTLYPPGALDPLALALESSAADVGKAAVDELIEKASAGDPGARELAKHSLDAKSGDVRAHALGRLPRLFESGSLEPWLLALSAKNADVRLAVIDRLIDSTDERVTEAFERALESDHEDLRMKAAVSLARRGDGRTVDVLAAFLRSEDRSNVQQALNALVELSRAKPSDPAHDAVRAAAAQAIAVRIEDDPDKTADRNSLIGALAQVGSPAAGPTLKSLLADAEPHLRAAAFNALMQIALDRSKVAIVLLDGTRRERYRELLALEYLEAATQSADVNLRLAATKLFSNVDDARAEGLLARMVEDREETVRVAAAEVLAFRAEHVDGATIEPLAKVLQAGRRELVLPAAQGLASQGRREAFQALMLVFKAGELPERQRAVLSLSTLGDDRAIEDLMVLVDPRSAEVTDDDRALAPVAAEALGAMLPKIQDPEKAVEVRETVERLAREGASNVRQRAVVGLRRAGDERSRTLIERIVGDRYEDFAVRHEGIKQLGIARSAGSEAVLAEVIEDDNRTLRLQALEALGRIFPDDKTRVSLLALNSRHWDINQPAAAFLAQRGDPTTLVSRIAEIKDQSVRRRLRQGLVRRGACPVGVLAQLLGGDQPAPRAEAAWIAGATGGPELAQAVLSAVARSHDDWERERTNGRHDLPAREEAWLAALWAAGRLAADATTHALTAAGNAAAPPAVRKEALRFIQAKGDSGALAVVKTCLSAEDRGVRAAAAAAVVAIARDRSAALLREIPVADAPAMLPVADAAIPIAGRELLSTDSGRQLVLPVMVGMKRIDELIAIALEGGQDPLRLVAIATLGRVGGKQAIAALAAILETEKEDIVRAAAFKALRRAQRGSAKMFADGQDQERRGGSFGGFPSGGLVGADDDDDDDDDDFDDDDDDDFDDDDDDDFDDDDDDDFDDDDDDDDDDEGDD